MKVNQGPVFDIDEVVARLKHAAKRMLRTVEEARASDEIWRVLAFGGDTRKAVAASPASNAALIYERATRDTQIVMITRLLDPPGRSGALKTNRISFPVGRELLALPGVLDKLIEEAKAWPAHEPHENVATSMDRLARFHDRLKALEDEDPNRARRLRDFRDENIAHELKFDVLPPRPVVRDLHDMVVEEMRLVEDFSFVVDGTNIAWSEDSYTNSAKALWDAVAAVYPV